VLRLLEKNNWRRGPNTIFICCMHGRRDSRSLTRLRYYWFTMSGERERESCFDCTTNAGQLKTSLHVEIIVFWSKEDSWNACSPGLWSQVKRYFHAMYKYQYYMEFWFISRPYALSDGDDNNIDKWYTETIQIEKQTALTQHICGAADQSSHVENCLSTQFLWEQKSRAIPSCTLPPCMVKNLFAKNRASRTGSYARNCKRKCGRRDFQAIHIMKRLSHMMTFSRHNRSRSARQMYRVEWELLSTKEIETT